MSRTATIIAEAIIEAVKEIIETTEDDFHRKLISLNVGMGPGDYDRYKLLAIYKQEVGQPKRGMRIVDIVDGIYQARQKKEAKGSAEYQAGQQAFRSGKTQEDNPYLGQLSKAGIRRFSDEEKGTDWTV